MKTMEWPLHVQRMQINWLAYIPEEKKKKHGRPRDGSKVDFLHLLNRNQRSYMQEMAHSKKKKSLQNKIYHILLLMILNFLQDEQDAVKCSKSEGRNKMTISKECKPTDWHTRGDSKRKETRRKLVFLFCWIQMLSQVWRRWSSAKSRSRFFILKQL